MMSRVGVAVIGGGPAGLSAAISASTEGASVLLVEQDARLGGILKQCIHDDFGFTRYDERLAGPEYAFRDISLLEQTNTIVLLQTFVSQIIRNGSTFQLTLCNRHGIFKVEATTIVFATGCRERTAKQASIHGMMPSGVMTAGTAQYYMNIHGQMPTKRCVIFGSNDIGMIMARRLTLEGAKVLGVFEPADAPVGRLRYVTQCLNDFDIPLHFEHTVSRTFGSQRLRAVEICRVDKNQNPVNGSESIVKCDGLIISAGLIPENDLAEALGIPLSDNTQGPICDQNYMTMVDGAFSCGNAMQVSDLVDYVSESGEIAGRSAARYMQQTRRYVKINASKDFLTFSPHCIDFDIMRGDIIIFFRARTVRENATVCITVDGAEVFTEEYTALRPSEMERISVNLSDALNVDSKIDVSLI